MPPSPHPYQKILWYRNPMCYLSWHQGLLPEGLHFRMKFHIEGSQNNEREWLFFWSSNPTPAKRRYLFSRPFASGADDDDGDNGEGYYQQEGKVDHRPTFPFSHPSHQEMLTGNRLTSLWTTAWPAFNLESAVRDSDHPHFKIFHPGEVEVQVARGEVQLSQNQPSHILYWEEQLRACRTRGGPLQK